MIIGTGVDIVEVTRIETLRKKHGSRFLRRHFTEEEIQYCIGMVDPARHFAGRFAAKEAVYKALSMNWEKGFNWKQIAISRRGGAPDTHLSGLVQRRAENLSVSRINLSISHCREYAVAFAVISGGE